MNRVQLWSCGLGRQSVLMLGLIKRGEIPRPDHVVTVNTERERSSSWAYCDRVFRPELASLGIPFTVIKRSDYATVDLWSGEDGDTLLIPAYTDRDGAGKLPEFCSIMWKQRPVMRWAAEQPGWKERGVDSWLGITLEEQSRRRAPNRKWFSPVYPLLDIRPCRVTLAYQVAHEFGWPDPPRSCCWMCPNMGNAEWREIRDHWPQDFENACDLDEEIRKTDPNVFVHRQRVALRLADLGQDEGPGLFGGCSSGVCY